MSASYNSVPLNSEVVDIPYSLEIVVGVKFCGCGLVPKLLHVYVL